MRLRRLELVVITLTLAFVCFIGGFFTGRGFSAVTIEGVAAATVESAGTSGDAVMQADPSISNDPQSDGGSNRQGDHNLPEPPEPSPGAPRGGDGKININTATKNELMDLPGVGPAIADRIIEYRQQFGRFETIEDIMNVSGIAEGRFGRIKDKITV